ncbi:hypothetical protein SPH9361_02258 [Sphingobium sp. CECT 9361]|nr:hypothetical protein SPH9361_02258 [Sphingobium sp. CECT 9361]
MPPDRQSRSPKRKYVDENSLKLMAGHVFAGPRRLTSYAANVRARPSTHSI